MSVKRKKSLFWLYYGTKSGTLWLHAMRPNCNRILFYFSYSFCWPINAIPLEYLQVLKHSTILTIRENNILFHPTGPILASVHNEK